MFLGLLILMPLPPEWQNYRYALPYLVYGVQTHGFVHAQQTLYQLSYIPTSPLLSFWGSAFSNWPNYKHGWRVQNALVIATVLFFLYIIQSPVGLLWWETRLSRKEAGSAEVSVCVGGYSSLFSVWEVQSIREESFNCQALRSLRKKKYLLRCWLVTQTGMCLGKISWKS